LKKFKLTKMGCKTIVVFLFAGLLIGGISLKANAGVATCEELFGSDPTQTAEQMLELLENSQDAGAETQVIKLFSQMINSADAKLSDLIIELGQNPLLTSTYAGRPEAESLNMKLAKDVVSLQKATAANPNFMGRVLRTFHFHSEKRIAALQAKVQQGHFDVTQAVAQMTKENEFYVRTEQDLTLVLNDLKTKIDATQELMGQLEHAQVFGSLSDRAQASLKMTILPHLAGVLKNMASIYAVTTQFSYGLAPRIATNKRLISEIESIIVNLVPAVVMTANRPVNLKPLDRHGFKGVRALELDKLNEPLVQGQEVATVYGIGQVVTIFQDGEVSVGGYGQRYLTFKRSDLAVRTEHLSSEGFEIGERVNVSGKYFADIRGFLPNGDVIIEVEVEKETNAFVKESISNLRKINETSLDFAQQFAHPLQIGQEVVVRAKIRGIGYVVGLERDGHIRLANTTYETGETYKRAKIGLTTAGLKKGGYTVGDRFFIESRPVEVKGMFENGDLYIAFLDKIDEKEWIGGQIFSVKELAQKIYQIEGSFENLKVDPKHGTKVVTKDGFEGRVIAFSRITGKVVVDLGENHHRQYYREVYRIYSLSELSIVEESTP